MGGIFSLDSKLMQAGNKFADLMWLNILTLVCCLPIITIGASFTAMHNVLLKIHRGDESYITRQFFKSFKENFKQSTIIFLIYVLFLIFLIADFSLINDGILQMPKFIKYILYIVSVLGAFSFTWVFVLQSRYENRIWITIRNSLVIGISKLWYSVMMILFTLIPLLAVYYFDIMIPVVFLLGFTVPGILQTMLYSKVFDQLEGLDRKALKEQQEDDGWTVEPEENPEATEGADSTAVENAMETTEAKEDAI